MMTSSRRSVADWLGNSADQKQDIRVAADRQHAISISQAKDSTTIMEAETPATTKRECNRLRLWLAFAVLAFTAAVAFDEIRNRLMGADRRAAADLDALILGRDNIQLTGLVIDKQQRRVICTDQEVLAYLASSLGNLLHDWGIGGGIFYEFTFQFSTGRKYRVDGYVHRQEWSLVVPNANPEEGHRPTHVTFLHAPIPDRVREMFEFLNKRYQEVSGTVLVLEPDLPPRYDYLVSLDLERRRR